MRSSRWRSWPYRASGLVSPWYRMASREIRRAGGPGPEARRHVDQKLCDYLRYSRQYSPYWERWPRDAVKLRPENAREVLATLPPLGKEALREHEAQLGDVRLCRAPVHLVRATVAPLLRSLTRLVGSRHSWDATVFFLARKRPTGPSPTPRASARD